MWKLKSIALFALQWTVLFMIISSFLFLLFFTEAWVFLLYHFAVFPLYFLVAFLLTVVYFGLRSLKFNSITCIFIMLCIAGLISAFTLEDFEYYAGIGRKNSRILSIEKIIQVSVQEIFRFVGFITSLIWVIIRDKRLRNNYQD